MESVTVLVRDEEGSWLGISYDSKIHKDLLHVGIKSWSPQTYKRYYANLLYVLHKLRENGIMEVYAICTQPKSKKFNEMFGFRESDIPITGMDGEKYFLMRRETV